jgi:acyl carrier protein
MNEAIRKVLDEHANLPVSASSLGERDDLYNEGLTSHASVNVMLGLEDEFDIEFPDRLLRSATFQSISAIHDALVEIGVTAAD